uniref:Phospholipid-transporting ATPase n=1 Tax=Alexandrium monilatum TaxID=311494 RepID=A0A7S4QNF9_9DINO
MTQNVMEYKACSIAGRIYGLEEEEEEFPKAPPTASSAAAGVSVLQSLKEDVEEGRAGQHDNDVQQAIGKVPHVCFRADAFRRDLGATEDVGRQAALASFLLCHALCHTVEVEGGEGSNLRGSRLSRIGTAPLYNGSSPDELALVYMAYAMGLQFVRFAEGRAVLRVRDAALSSALEAACGGPRSQSNGAKSAILDVEVLDVCEFDNNRKRSSIVVRYPDGQLVLLLKGADTSVLPYVRTGVGKCEEHLSYFAQRGLRTLCLASCYLSQDEYAAWHDRYAQAQALVSSDRAEQVQLMADELETGRPLDLLGATAIEDRLQDNVPETIEQLRAAGICVWVLTGDKVETAISIALSCRLLTPEMENILIEDPSPEAVDRDLAYALRCESPALTVAGAALSTALASEDRQLRFLEAAVRCRSVVCCRVSPKQKADVVQLVKVHKAESTTLSIGDGANDVSMIVAAHVGVGISGKEGAQAAYTADFAISEFRYLRRLLFVHGRESYRRMSVVIAYNFYKNMLLVTPTLLFAPLSGFTGQNVFFPWLCQLYNVLYTHVAVCVYGIFDRQRADLDDLEVDSREYARRQFSPPRAFAWIFASWLQATVIYTVAAVVFDGGYLEGGQGLADLNSIGFIRFLWVVLCANITMAMRHTSWLFGIMVPAYAVNIGAAFVSVWAIDRAVVLDLLGANLPRFLLATVLVIITSTLIGEAVIRNSAAFEVLSCKPKREALQSSGQPLGTLQTRSSVTEVEMVDIASMTFENVTSITPSEPDKEPPLGSKRSSLGYAFAQECVLERRFSHTTSRQSLTS